MAFYSAQDFEQYYVTNVTRFEQIRDEALVEVCQTRVPICDVPNEPIDSTAAKMELCRRYRPLIVKYERLLVNRTVEDDVEAMLWLTFIESIYTYNLAGTVPFTGYVKMAIHFKYLNHYKRIKQRWNHEFHIPDTADGDEQLTMDQIPDAIDVANQIVHREERVQQYHLLRRALRLLKVDQLQLMIDIYMDEVVICRMLQDSKIVHVNRCNNDINDTKGHSQRGQKNIDEAVNLSVSIGSTSKKQGQVVDTNTYQGGTLVSDSTVHITARDTEQSGIGLTGETVQAKKLVLDSASDINLAAGKNTVDVKNTYKSSGWSVGAGISLTGGGLLDINASGNMARQNGDTHQESYVPTTIKAAQLAQLKAKRDTTIIGSTVSGKKVEVDTGRDLHMQSLQDVDNFKEHSKSAGFSVSSKPNFKNPTGSISASVGRIDSKWKSVTHQAGIYAGEDGYDINVGDGTTLEGAVIKSDAPKAKNTLTTKSLEMKDIQNEAEYTYSNNGIGYNYYGSKKNLEEMKTNDKKGYDKIYNNIGLVPNLGVGSKGKASSTTQSAISDGILTVDGKQIDTKTINTNTENTLHQLDKIFDKKKIEERQELARLFAKNAFEEVHRLSDKYDWKDGSAQKVALHAAIGEIAAQLAGNPNGSGAVAAGVNELAIKKIIDKVGKNHPDQAQILSAALGGTVNKLLNKPLSSGTAVSSYGTKWNYEGIRVPREYPIAAYLNADGSYQFVDEYGNKINREDIKLNNLVIWVEKEYNTGIGYTMMINRDGKPDAYYNGSIKEQGKGQTSGGWVVFGKTHSDIEEYRTLKGSANPTDEKVSPMDPMISNFTEKKKGMFGALGFNIEDSLKHYTDPLNFSWSAVVSSLDYKASKVANRYLPVGTIMNYGAMLKADGNFNKYGVTGAATRVKMDVVYIGGMLYVGSRLKPLAGAGASYLNDTTFSNIKDGVAPTLSETEAKKDFDKWYEDALHTTE